LTAWGGDIVKIKTLEKLNYYDFFTCSVEEKVATIIIDNPPLNLLGFLQYQALCNTILKLINTKQAKAVIVTGTNKAFISGLDIKDIFSVKTPEENDKETLTVKALFRQIEKLKRPVIAAIDGNCFGGGVELALSCHFRIANREAKLGLPEINVGTIPTFGGTQRLPRLIGKAKALELMLTGKFISGDEALKIGLVNDVFPSSELLDRAKSLARNIAGKSINAVEAVMQASIDGLEMEIDKGILLESHVSSSLIGGYNLKEGITAFFERRKPVFKDE
jgi:enoyl-CoA hydratase/carnithine racemase